MKLYKIASNVPINGSDNASTDVLRFAAGAVASVNPVLAVANAASLAKEVQALKIASLEELQNFTCVENKLWQHDVFYAEHPMHPRLLIPQQDYKTILLREVVADVSNYILDHISVQKLTFGLVRTLSSGLDASFPVKKIDINAKLNCQVYRSYYYHVEDSVCKHEKRSYVWIDTFPEIKSAVDHEAGSMENIVTSTFDFSGELGLANMLGINAGFGKGMQFYISYVKK